MTNEKNNNQFTNSQLNKGQDRTDRPYQLGYWLLFVSLVIGIWSLSIVFLPL